MRHSLFVDFYFVWQIVVQNSITLLIFLVFWILETISVELFLILYCAMKKCSLRLMEPWPRCFQIQKDSESNYPPPILFWGFSYFVWKKVTFFSSKSCWFLIIFEGSQFFFKCVCGLCKRDYKKSHSAGVEPGSWSSQPRKVFSYWVIRNTRFLLIYILCDKCWFKIPLDCSFSLNFEYWKLFLLSHFSFCTAL